MSNVTDGTNTATLVTNVYDGTTPYCPLPGPGNPGGCSQPPCNSGVIGQPNICEHDNANYPTAFNYRGNLTSSTTPTSTTTISYDTFGTGTATSTTVNGATSTVGTTNNFAAPGAVTTNSLLSTMNWNSFLGLTSASGPNGASASIGYDANARPSTTTSPYGDVTTYTYNDTASPPNKIATINTTHWVKTVMDGFGRTIHTITGNGTTTVSTVDTQYAPCGCSPLGKLSQQSQPYAPGGSDAWTVYHYDASGRTTSVVLPDTTSTTTYAYQGNVVTVTDPAAKWKTFTMDAFGNLTTVLEPDPGPPPSNVTTSYTYDILNHLIGVSMPRATNTQTRTFNYNSGSTVTGLLQSATNPENGTVSYTYDANYHLASKTDAKNQQLLYQIDAYNRLYSVKQAVPYTCPPPPQPCNPPPPIVLRTYYYDTTSPMDTTQFSQNISGRLAAVQYPAFPGTSIQMNDMYSYTQAGLPATKRQQVNEPVTYLDQNNTRQNTTLTSNLDSGYTYNTEGEIATMSYPSTMNLLTPTAGPSYTYSYDSMYRLSGMKQSTTTIVSNVSYNAANQLLSINYPTGTETRAYNTLGQLTNVTVQLPYYPYTYPENLTYTYPTGTNNGKASSMYNAVSGETVTYTYDSLNRLLTANGSGWGQQYGFDGFGNLLSKTVTAGSGPSLSVSVNAANNQIQGVSGLSYDANGNQNAGIYDAENRMVVGPGMYYGYDAQNKRIWSWTGAVDSYGNTTNYTVNVYSASGQKLGAYAIATVFVNNSQTMFVTVPSLNVTLSAGDQYFGGRRLAAMDQLGSVGNYFPWGEDKGGTSPQDTWNYATYWRDSASGLDYANNRYYSNAYGRFMTPDPYQASASTSNPQSWNRYAYVNGEPVNGNDPTGLYLPLPVASSGAPGDWGYGGSGASGGLLGDDGDSSNDPSWDLLWSVWVQLGGTGGGSGSSGGGTSSGVAAENLAETQDATDAYNDLAKSNCYKLLGFATAAAAQSWFTNHITFTDVQLGDLQVKNGAPALGTPPPSETSGYGAVYLNTDYNWADFSKVATSTGGTYNYLGYLNKVYGSNMTSEQLGTFLIMHELLHNRPSDIGETAKAGQTIINDCLK